MDSKGKATNDDMEREQEQEQEQEHDPNCNELGEEETELNSEQQERQQASRTRTPFTTLSQVDADLALARTLQEQERAYMMLGMNNSEGSDYGNWVAGSDLHDDDDDDGEGEGDARDQENNEYDGSDVVDEDDDDEDEDAFYVHAPDEVEEDNNLTVEYDSDVFSTDEAYARALQDAEEREMEDPEDPGGHSQDTWDDVDPDELSYEELLALGEVVGTASRGLSTDTIASLPTVNYKAGTSQNGSNDSHSYHSECINNWLKINKVCPVCSAEVSTSGHS